MKYIDQISLSEDISIFFKTILKAFVKQEGITEEGMATAADLGDYLLSVGRVSRNKYDALQIQAKQLISEMSVK